MPYISEPKINWYRSPIDKAQLAQLMQRSDLRGWVQTIAHIGLFLSTAGLAYWVFSQIESTNYWWTLPGLFLALFLHGTIGPFMGLIAIHELQHRTVFKTRWLNEFFEKAYAFISWSDYIWYQQSHALHHQSTCHREYDGEVVLPVKFSLTKPGVWLGLLAWNPAQTWLKLRTVWCHANGQLTGPWYHHVLPEAEPELRQRHKNWARTLLFGHGLLATLFILSGHWFLVVVFTFGTQYCSWLGFLCGVPQHYGLNSEELDFRLNTRTFTCSRLVGFYYWNMQYHLEHHMYPAVPFFNLPRLRDTIGADLPPATHGLKATWDEILAIKAAASAERDYKFMPALPVTRPPAVEPLQQSLVPAVSLHQQQCSPD